jgi:hypothetical protein
MCKYNRNGQRPNPNKNPIYAGADYNLALCPLQSRFQHIHHWQPYARVDFNPIMTFLYCSTSFWFVLVTHEPKTNGEIFQSSVFPMSFVNLMNE